MCIGIYTDGQDALYILTLYFYTHSCMLQQKRDTTWRKSRRLCVFGYIQMDKKYTLF